MVGFFGRPRLRRKPQSAGRIVFFNHYHNGDIYLSRPYIDQLTAAFPDRQYAYAHKNPASLLADIHGLEHSPDELAKLPKHKRWTFDSRGDGTLFINTWMGTENRAYVNQFGICVQAARQGVSQTYQELFDLKPLPLSQCVPKVAFERFFIQCVNKFVSEEKRLKVLVSNGPALSKQSDNVDLTPIIEWLARRFPNVLFIPTTTTTVALSNVVHSADIIRKGGPDLNENAYLGTFCEIIVGRSSGPYSFSMNRENLDQSKTFIGFVNHPLLASLGFHDPEFSPRCTFVASSEYQAQGMTNLIAQHVQSHLDRHPL